MNRILVASILLALGMAARCATVTRDADSVTFTETTGQGFIECIFKKCMANDLFTFYNVSLDGVNVNSARYSDNIGPFLVVGNGWIGGNHLSDSGKKTAKTISVEVSVDGNAVTEGTCEASAMQVDVVNELYMPDGTVFAIETVKYLVAGNSIEVWATHDYRIAQEQKIDRYYGMQSMFEGETEILAPGSKKYNRWITFTPGGADNAVKIKNYEAPKLSVFVEKSPVAYQAAYMMREDLGKRGKLGIEDVIFIGNSYGKSYHKLIGSAKIQPGETTAWHGVYSWFKTPVTDTFLIAADAPVFEYPAYIGGNPVVIRVDESGIATVIEQAGAYDPRGMHVDNKVEYYNLNGCKAAGPLRGQMCLKSCAGEISKILVK